MAEDSEEELPTETGEQMDTDMLAAVEQTPPEVERILRELAQRNGWDYDALTGRSPGDEKPAPD